MGFRQGEVQSETVLTTIRLLASVGPVLFLGLAVWISRGYPLTRDAHARVVAELAERDRRC